MSFNQRLSHHFEFNALNQDTAVEQLLRMIACVKSKDATLLHQQVIQERLVDPPMQTPETDAKLRFDDDNRLQVEL